MGATDCAICEHVHEHGWWGDDVKVRSTHHRCCHVTISGKRPHCVECCRTFATDRLAEKHRVGFVCQDPATMTDRAGRAVFRLGDDGFWHGREPVVKPESWGRPAAAS